MSPPPPEEEGSRAGASQVPRPQEKLILIVDDEEDIVTMFKFALEKEGFQTLTASNGEEALSRVSAQTPDMILLDLMMPVLGGFEALRRFQEHSTLRKVPVLLITAKHLDRSTQEMMLRESNVVGFFSKPVSVPALVQRVHKQVGTGVSDQRILEEYRKSRGITEEQMEQIRKAQRKLEGLD